LIKDLTPGKELISSGMTKERDRCAAALELAAKGKTVALVSSGDAGIYGMAGLALEMAQHDELDIAIEIAPGITAAGLAAARLGAPLMLDFACISLSDLLVPWETILKRLKAVAEADLVVALYNPKSKKRTTQIEQAATIFREFRPPATPVGIGNSVGTEDERITLTDLEHFLDHPIDMRTIVIIGNRSSKVVGNWFVTPRGYEF
jgi:precorrin-3B C17-methyltransferase